MNCYRLTTLLEIVHGTQPHSSRLVQNGVHYSGPRLEDQWEC